MLSGIDRRRTIRIRRSSLLKYKLDYIDRPAIKIAETPKEYSEAFKLVYGEYHKEGYVQDHQSEMLYSVYNFLPKTATFVFKSFETVISTLTMIVDTPQFGLPMDTLYKDELRSLREEGRKIAEVSNLATQRMRRWSNLMVYLSKALFQYATMSDVNDLVIMVNPKHVRFYSSIFLFEPLGEEKMYETVGAPAVALRVNMDTIREQLRDAYGDSDFDTDLHAFFIKVNNTIMDPEAEYAVEKNRVIEMSFAGELLEQRPEILKNLTEAQCEYLGVIYHQAFFRSRFFCGSQRFGHA